MGDIFIEEISLGQEVCGVFALRSAKLLPFRNSPGHYLAAVLGDKTGQVEGRAWESGPEIYQSCRTGDIVRVQGLATEYNDRVQIQIAAMTACRDSEIEPERFIPSSNLDSDTALLKLDSLLQSITDPHLNKLLSAIFTDQDFLPVFLAAPAARRNHHATTGGLAEHSLGVAVAAKKIAGAYPGLDRDLLIAGALLHDIGKVKEYSLGTDISFTDEGRLLGHIVLGMQLLDRYVGLLPGFPDHLKLKLTHMIVSHHGQYEWQSPKRPKFIEAAILHHLDMIDTAVDMFNSAVESREDTEEHWSGWVRALDRQVFCK